jgi:hypothetical protein
MINYPSMSTWLVLVYTRFVAFMRAVPAMRATMGIARDIVRRFIQHTPTGNEQLR